MALKRALATLIGGLIALGSGIVSALGVTGPVDYVLATADIWSTVLLGLGRFGPEALIGEYQQALVFVGGGLLIAWGVFQLTTRTHEWLTQ